MGCDAVSSCAPGFSSSHTLPRGGRRPRRPAVRSRDAGDVDAGRADRPPGAAEPDRLDFLRRPGARCGRHRVRRVRDVGGRPPPGAAAPPPPTGFPAGRGCPGSRPTRSSSRCSSLTAGVPGPRWRVLLRADLAAMCWIAGLAAFATSPPPPLVVATGMLVAVLIAAGLASAVVRYRRADVTQRVQIRECVFAACAAFVGFFAISVIAPHEALYALDYALLPLSVGLAMLRYRLYDVDVIIRKTLVYAGVLGRRLSGGRHAAGRGASRAHRLVGRRGGHALDARRGGRVPAAAAPDPAGRRSAVLPIGLRRAGRRGAFSAASASRSTSRRCAASSCRSSQGQFSPPTPASGSVP